jgi:hypothetical protein
MNRRPLWAAVFVTDVFPIGAALNKFNCSSSGALIFDEVLLRLRSGCVMPTF